MEQESFISWNIINFLLVAIFHFLSSERYVLKFIRNLRLESSISGKTREFLFARVVNIPFPNYKKSSVISGFWIKEKFRFLKYREFFFSGFPFPEIQEKLSLEKTREIFSGLPFLKYKNSFLLRKYQKVLISELKSSIFPGI